MIDHRVNQAAAQVLLQTLLLTAASIGQLWLREIAMSLDFCLLSLPYCLCYSLTHLSWHPVDLGLDTIDHRLGSEPLVGQICGRYLSRSNITERPSCAAVRQRLVQANISSTWSSWLTAFAREEHAYFTPEDPALSWSQFVSPAELCTHQL